MLAVDNDFKISILLGVAGTFLFFFSLSGFLLELAKRSKKFYYNGLNMFVLRQINSKITTTFVSMSMLCLMLFLAISAFATGSGLASSVKTDLEDMTKFDCTFYGLSEKGYQEEQQQKFIKKLDDLGLTIKKDAKEITEKKKPEKKKLPEAIRKKIRTELKDEKLPAGKYTSIYKAVEESENKLALNNALVKTFDTSIGSRIYNHIKKIYEDYQR